MPRALLSSEGEFRFSEKHFSCCVALKMFVSESGPTFSRGVALNLLSREGKWFDLWRIFKEIYKFRDTAFLEYILKPAPRIFNSLTRVWPWLLPAQVFNVAGFPEWYCSSNPPNSIRGCVVNPKGSTVYCQLTQLLQYNSNCAATSLLWILWKVPRVHYSLK